MIQKIGPEALRLGKCDVCEDAILSLDGVGVDLQGWACSDCPLFQNQNIDQSERGFTWESSKTSDKNSKDESAYRPNPDGDGRARNERNWRNGSKTFGRK